MIRAMRLPIIALACLLALPALAQNFGGSGNGAGIPQSAVGAAGGVASLNGSGLVPVAQSQGAAAIGGLLASSAGPLNFLYNNNPPLLRHARAAIGRVLGGTGNARILFAGDSTTFGAYSSATDTNDKAQSYPSVVANFLAGQGIPAQASNFVGGGSAGYQNILNADPRVAKGSWFLDGHVTAGGNLLSATAAGTPLTFSPTTPVNSYRVWYVVNSGLGSITLTASGGTATTVSTAGSTAGIASTVVTGTLSSTSTLTVNWGGGGTVYVVAIEAYNSGAPTVEVMNAGWPGSTSGNWNNNLGVNAFDPTATIQALAPDLTVVDLGINDWNGVSGTVTVATYMANMTAILTAAKTVGDCIVVTPAPTAVSMTPLATQQSFVSAAIAVANNVGCPVIDNFSRWTSYEITSALGMYANTVHPNAVGYADFALPVADLIARGR